MDPSAIPPGPFYKSPLPADTSDEFDVNVFPTLSMAGMVVVLNLRLSWTNIVAEERTQMSQTSHCQKGL